jgi:hypothetical protein
MPTIKDITDLLISLKSQICDDDRASDDLDDTLPGMQVTIGYTPDDKSWDYQTGDNSFTGSAYGHPYWAVIDLYRKSNCRDLARDAVNELKDAIAMDS